MTGLFLSLEVLSSFQGTWERVEVGAEKGILDQSGTWLLLKLLNPGFSALALWHFRARESVLGTVLCPLGCLAAALACPHDSQ